MKNKKNIFKYLELALIFLSAFSIWWLADKLFSVSYLNNWGWIIFFVSIFFVAWFLGALVIRDRRFFLLVTLASLLLQLFFTRNIFSLIIVFFSFLALYWARKMVREELRIRRRIKIWDSLRVGRHFFIFAVALMLSGQYYFFSNPQIESGNLPKLGAGSNQDGLMVKIITLADTDLVRQDGGFATVDEFVFEKFRGSDMRLDGKMEDGTEYKALKNRELSQIEKDNIIEKGRSDISKMAEREVLGDEQMIFVFVEILNKKLDDFMNINVGYLDQEMPVMHLVFSVILFLAIYGTGTIVSWFLVFFVAVIFRFLVITGLLSIEKKAVNMEIIRVS